MKVKSIIYMVLALSLCCGCSDWLTVDSKTILSEEDIAKYPELAEAQFLSNYAELRKSIHCIGDEQCRTGNIIWMLLPMMERAILPTRMGS